MDAVELAQSVGSLKHADSYDRYNPAGLTQAWLNKLDRKSNRTRKLYERAFKSWMTYCFNSGIHPFEARRVDVDDWIDSLGTKSSNTVNAYQSGVRNWYTYMQQNGATEAEPVGDSNRATIDRDVTNTPALSADEVTHLLDSVTQHAARLDTEASARDAAILRIMLTTGVRSAPILNGTFDDLGANRGHRVLNFINKGGRRYQAPLTPYAATMLDRYHDLRATRLGCERAELEGHLFVTVPYRKRTGDRPLVSRDLRNLVRMSARRAGIESADTLVPHSLRHSVITSLFEQNVPINKVQDLVGHADPRMTRLYDHSRGRLDDSPAYQMAAFISERSNHPDERTDA